MTFEFTVHPAFNFVKSFGEHFKIPVYGDGLKIPASMGKGFIKKVDVEDGFKFVLHHYTLKKDFHLKRKASEEINELISIVFNSNEVPTAVNAHRQSAIQFLKNNGSSIQIASSSLGTETFFPANSEVSFGVIGIKRSVLGSLLRVNKKISSPVESILHGNDLFFYHERMNPEVQRTLKQLTEINGQHSLSPLYYGIKIHELIYLLFARLLDRGIGKQSPVNRSDVEKINVIRTTLLADISAPPKLSSLSKMVGMSETKMKQLFKQTFGDSIYNYYQNERMREAGFLLKQGGYSVSEVGYQLGFSNLSHFSRLFEKHYGLTPKKYSLAG